MWKRERIFKKFTHPNFWDFAHMSYSMTCTCNKIFNNRFGRNMNNKAKKGRKKKGKKKKKKEETISIKQKLPPS